MGGPLKEIGQALPNMADIDYQTLAGAIATSTHGTGAKYGSYSSQVVGLRLVTAAGEILDCDAHVHPEVFNAARVSLGALGIVSRVRLQNRNGIPLAQQELGTGHGRAARDMPRLIRGKRSLRNQFTAAQRCLRGLGAQRNPGDAD